MKEIDIEEFLQIRHGIPVVDVRSPSEFKRGHIPGANNIPLFDDDQRARVGIRYHRQGREEAIMEGLRIVGPHMEALAKQARALAGQQRKLILHCWRGGMRSESMAWLFERLSIQTYVLKGGYKTYRRYGRARLQQPASVVVLSGYTGSGKTDILQALEREGEQVLDLEGLARHKGSAFGAMGQKEQLPNEHFENLIFEKWFRFNLNQPIWIEDESKMIGKNGIPDELFAVMRSAPVIRLEMSKSLRVERLVQEYACFDQQKLHQGIDKIRKRLGGDKARKAHQAIDQCDFHTAIDITLDYYDKAYLHGLKKRNHHQIYPLETDRDDPDCNARMLSQKAPQLLNDAYSFHS